jgi:hypothetical protein
MEPWRERGRLKRVSMSISKRTRMRMDAVADQFNASTSISSEQAKSISPGSVQVAHRLQPHRQHECRRSKHVDEDSSGLACAFWLQYLLQSAVECGDLAEEKRPMMMIAPFSRLYPYSHH